jgi:ubiquinone/menaquinone biosynthesis C-methylase UbiE
MERLSKPTYAALDNVNYFDRWSKHYDDGRISKWFQYTQELTIGILDLNPDSKVLDVGCGTGHAVLRVASLLPHGRACGIDVSRGMVKKASSKVPRERRNSVEFIEASSESIPYQDGYFDHVLCTNSFHHYPDPLKALGEMQRVLRPGGQVVIFENATDLSWYTWLWDWILRFTEKGHVQYYTSVELGQLLKEAGFARPRLCYLKNEFLSHGKLYASIQVWTGYAPDSKLIATRDAIGR